MISSYGLPRLRAGGTEKVVTEVIKMEESDDFYVAFENYLDDDEISPEEEGFMKGFTANIDED